jgi:hypothetical protein
MKKFFIVGDHCLVLGIEKSSDVISFSVGSNLFDQEPLADFKMSGVVLSYLESNSSVFQEEGMILATKTAEKYFGKIVGNPSVCKQGCLDRPDSGLISKEKYDDIASVYDNPFLVPWNFVYTEIEEILDCFKEGLLEAKKTLYIGAGYGKNIWAIKDFGYDIDSIEFSREAVDRANAIFGREIMYERDITSFKGFGEKKYDIVLDIGCIHCIPRADQYKAIDSVYNLLEDGGVLVSRIFKPKDRSWIDKMPFRADSFGLEQDDINSLLSSRFIVSTVYENDDYIIISAKKC